MDSFASSGRKHVNSLSDLRMIWDDAPDLRAIDIGDARAIFDLQATQIQPAHTSAPAVSRPRCQSVRVEHVFITTDDVMAGRGPRFGVLEKRILHSALQLQKSIESELRGRYDPDSVELQLDCVQVRPSFPGRPSSHELSQHSNTDDACLTLSPLEYWNLDSDTILAEDDPAQLVSHSTLNRTLRGVPISFSTTLAGRWHLFKRLPRAEYLAFTFFLRQDSSEGGCSDLSASTPPAARPTLSHSRWHELLNRVTGGQVRLIASPESVMHSLVLRFSPEMLSSRRRPTHILLLTAYAFVILYISRGLIKLRKVHSRFGLAFTGTTQLLISMVMSVSICALLGIRLTLVPWELLPFVIVVVGSENMFSLTKAIIDTPLSLTVSSRIAHGLGKVGVPITLTTLADILLLLVIAFFIGVRAVREFCIFAIFSLMMDWFLQMTFFVTVLSIDMQRLELADLLTQGTRLTRKQDSALQMSDGSTTQDSAGSIDQATGDDQPDGTLRKQVRSTNIVVTLLSQLWKARSARTASLTLILVYMSGLYLYYGTGYPSLRQSSFVLPADWDTVRQAPATNAAFDPFGHLDAKTGPSLPWWTSSPSADLWTSLNPLGASELRVHVEPWTILSLRSSNDAQSPPSMSTFAGWALFRPRIRAVIWFAKLVILPISGTTALLWMLLLYLLKDTELLDAQRDKSEADPSEGESGSLLNDSAPHLRPHTSIITNAHPCDVEFLVHDGALAASIDNGGGIRIWSVVAASGGDKGVEVMGSLGRTRAASDASVVTAAALSAEARWLSIGYESGRLHFVSTETLETIWDHVPDSAVSPVISLILQHHESMHILESATAISAHRDGTIRIWNVARKQVTLASAQTHLDPRLRWRSVHVNVAHHQGSAHGANKPSGSCDPSLLAFATTDGLFHIRSVEPATSSTKTVFTLACEDRSRVCSALLCQLASRPPSADEAALLRSTLVLGFANGRVRLIDFETAETISSVDLDDGPVTGLSTIDAGDASTPGLDSSVHMSIFPAHHCRRINERSFIDGQERICAQQSRRLPVRFAAAYPHAQWLSHQRRDVLGGTLRHRPVPQPSLPIRCRTRCLRMAPLRDCVAPVRTRETAAAPAWSPMAPSQAAAMSSSLSAFPNMLSPSTSTQKMDERQLRLLGWIRCERGGSFAVGSKPVLIGVGRAQRSPHQSRWEWWALDLRHELTLGRGGELLVPRQPLLLEAVDKTHRDATPRSLLSILQNGQRKSRRRDGTGAVVLATLPLARPSDVSTRRVGAAVWLWRLSGRTQCQSLAAVIAERPSHAFLLAHDHFLHHGCKHRRQSWLPREVDVFGGDRSAIYCVTGNLVGCEAGWLAVPASWMWPSVVLSQSARHARCASQIPQGKGLTFANCAAERLADRRTGRALSIATVALRPRRSARSSGPVCPLAPLLIPKVLPFAVRFAQQSATFDDVDDVDRGTSIARVLTAVDGKR
ncbi:hypothetical protein L1887_42557 [Cichorium endivia]|nr:hypothetical protein L1887_42557 [Cichorium endivia]